jgi:hypothetical protein
MEHKHLAIHVGKKTGATTLLYNFWNKWTVSLSFLKEAGQHIQIPRAREPHNLPTGSRYLKGRKHTAQNQGIAGKSIRMPNLDPTKL